MFESYRESRRTADSRRWAMVALVLGALAGAAARSFRKPDVPTVSFLGFGPIRIGMTVSEATDALGVRLVEDHASEPCHRARISGLLGGLTLMVVDGRIVRIDVTSDDFRAPGGVGVGSSERDLRRLYPEAAVEDHPRYRGGHYLVLTDPGQGHAMIFETTNLVVTTFRAGEREAVVQGCP